MNDTEKYVVDAVAAAGTTAAFFGWITNITAVFTLVWVVIRLWETKTVQSICEKIRGKSCGDG